MNHNSIKLTLESDDKNDLEKIKALAIILGVKNISQDLIENPESKEYYQKIVSKGGDMSYIQDPANWQRENQQDR